MLLENIHIDILKFGNIYVENHITQFLKLLKVRISALEKSYVDKKVTTFSISAADVLISELITDCFDFYQSIMEVFVPLQVSRKTCTVYFSTLVDMLINGVINKKLLQTTVTHGQFMKTNVCYNKDSVLNVNRRNMKERESPSIIYRPLKLHETIRSKTLIYQSLLPFRVMFISCMLEVAKELSDNKTKYK